MPHWTYNGDFVTNDDLMQGDIIQPTSDVRKILEEAHKHFLDNKYTAFIILTQTCDLVRRNDENQCKSRYINLAVIRPLEDVLISFLETECDSVKIGKTIIEGLFISESKSRAINLLSRIFNQNEHVLGLFYLHDDAQVGIAVPSVAMLQVSIALRRTHYDRLVSARSGRLNPIFQSRLGWIIGNLYSRVATPDWNEENKKELIDSTISPLKNSGKVPLWIPRATFKNASSKDLKIDNMTISQIFDEIIKYQPIPTKDIAIDRVLSIAKDIFPAFPPEEFEKMKLRLKNDQKFSSLFK